MRRSFLNVKTRCVLLALFTFSGHRDTERFLTSKLRQQRFGWEKLYKSTGVNAAKKFPSIFIPLPIEAIKPVDSLMKHWVPLLSQIMQTVSSLFIIIATAVALYFNSTMKEEYVPQYYLIEETVVSYLDVRRRVRDSLKHVYSRDRPKGAWFPLGPESKKR